MRAMIAVVVLLFLSACASHGQPITQAQIDRIKEGETTKQDLLSSFGSPVVTSKNSDGTEILGWAHAKVGFAGSSYTNQSITVVLDEQGRVLSYTTSDISDMRR